MSRTPARRSVLAALTPAALVLPLLALPTPALGAGLDTPVYSPGVGPGAQYTVSGNIWQDETGLYSVTNPGDVYLNGVKVYAYWVDEDGTASPTYYDITRVIGGQNGQFSIELDPFVDAMGVTHTFDAAVGERLRVWADNPDPSRYQFFYGESQFMLGTSTARDNNAWNAVTKSVTNWILTFREAPLATNALPAAQQVDRTGTSGASAIDPGNVEGRVFWDFAHVWGMTSFADYNPALGDQGAAGIRVTASYLSDAAVAQINAWKAANPGWTQTTLQAWINAQVAANPSWIAETIYTTTDATGHFDMTFRGTLADGTIDPTGSTPWISKHINKDYMYVYPTVPGDTSVMGPWDHNNWSNPGSESNGRYSVNNAVISGASNILYALLPANPLFDVQTFDSVLNPARPGQTAPTLATGLPAGTSGWSIVWRDDTGATVGQCTNLVVDANGALASCPFTVPTTLVRPTTYSATLVGPSGTARLADSFMALPITDTTPWGSVGDPYNGSVTVTLPAGDRATYTAQNLPAGLSIDPATGAITGTPTTPGTYQVLVTATITYANGTTGHLDIPVDIVVTDTPLPSGTVRQPYSTAVVPTGYPSGSTVSGVTVTGLPAGLGFDPATGRISGTPTAVGTSTVTVSYTVTTPDGTTHAVVDTVPLAVAADTTPPVINPITGTTVPEDLPIAGIPVGSNDPTATITCAPLPAGLTYNPATGQIEGTPTAPGTTTVTCVATDPSGNQSAPVSFTIEVTDRTAPVITPVADQAGTTGTPITPITIETDDPSATVVCQPLPAGLTYAGDQITGTPTSAGTTAVTCTATDTAGNSSTETFVITVDTPPDTTAPTITPVTDQTVTVGTPIQTVTVTTDDPAATLAVSGLPAGVTWDPATRQITGAPTTTGTWTVTITATDPAGNTATETFVITSNPVPDTTAPAISPIADQTVTVGTPIQPVTVTTDDPAATITVAGLPAGVTYDPATGQISGAPTAVGTSRVTVTATDPAGNTATTTFAITAAPRPDTSAPVITAVADQDVVSGSAIRPVQVVVDDPTATVTVAGLPAGVTWDPATGTIAGTPTGLGSSTVTITAVDPAGNTATETFVISVVPAPDTTSPVIAPIGDQTVAAGDPIAPVAVSVTDADPATTVTVSALPDGVTWDPATRTISGSPTTPGSYPITVTATDSAGNTATQSFTIGVTTNPPTADTTAPVVGLSPLGDQTITLGQAIAPVTVTVDDPTATITVVGMPPGVTWDPASGAITGTPTQVGVHEVHVSATDAAGNVGSASFTITVNPAADTTAPVLTPVQDQTVVVGAQINPVTVQVDDPGASITVAGMPAGVSYDPGTGLISGAPGAVGDYTVTITATDAAGNAATETFVIRAIPTPPPADLTAPAIRPIPDQTVDVGQGISPVHVDTDDPTATVTVTGLPAGVTYDPATGIIQGATATPGTYPVTVTAQDAAGNTSTETFLITVVHPDRTAPTLGALPDQRVPVTTLITDVTITSNDPTATITVTGLPEGVTYDAVTGTIHGAPTSLGSTTVTVTATDAAGNAQSETFVITAYDATAPVITPIGDQRQEVGAPITPVTVTTDDPSATVTVTGLPAGVSYDPETGLVAGTTPGTGSWTVTVTATDPAGNSTTETFVITTVDTVAPTVTTPDTTLPEDQPATVTITTDDPTATVSVDPTTLPPGMTFDPATGQVTGTPTTPGTYEVAVTATDPAGNTTTDVVVITVTDQTAPVITTPDVTAPVDVPIAVPVTTDDPGATVVVDASTLPPGTSYDPGTRSIVGTPTVPGTYPVTVTVTDAAGNVRVGRVVITITPRTVVEVVVPEPEVAPPAVGQQPPPMLARTGLAGSPGDLGAAGFTALALAGGVVALRRRRG